MSDEKVEGKEKVCGNCKAVLICVKITKEWKGKTETKLQWQTKSTGKAHFKFVGEGKYNCITPTIDEVNAVPGPEPLPQPEPEPTPEPKRKQVSSSIKLSSPFDEAELIARWAGAKAYKIVMRDVHDFSKLTQQEKSGLGQKEGMYTRLLADTVLELMKQHGIKTEYEK